MLHAAVETTVGGFDAGLPPPIVPRDGMIDT
jgi:hypothetical protein